MVSGSSFTRVDLTLTFERPRTVLESALQADSTGYLSYEKSTPTPAVCSGVGVFDQFRRLEDWGFRIRTLCALIVVTMYNYHPCRLAKSNIEKQYLSHCVNDINDGSPSRIRRVLRISLGMTILPRSSTRRTMPVAFISIPLLVANSQWYCLLKMPVYAGRKQDQEKPHPICSSNAVRFSSKKITGHMCMADRAEAMA